MSQNIFFFICQNEISLLNIFKNSKILQLKLEKLCTVHTCIRKQPHTLYNSPPSYKTTTSIMN
jgi:hypothetical protein